MQVIDNQAVEKMKAAYEELLRVALRDDAPSEVMAGFSQLRNAAAYLRQKRGGETKLSYRSLSEARRALRSAWVSKNVASTPGFRDKGEFYYHTRFAVDYVQNYLDVEIVDRIENVFERRISSTTGASGIVSEGTLKPYLEAIIGIFGNPFTKLAFTSLINEETLYANPAFLDYWIFYATQRLEFDLHNQIYNALLGNANIVTISSLGLPQPRFIDLIEYLRELYDLNAPEGIDTPDWRGIAAVVPQPYWLTRKIQQDSIGQARSLDVISDLAMIPVGTVDTSPTIVFGRYDMLVFVLDGVMVFFDRVVDEAQDRNTYRFTAELYYSLIPRSGVSRAVTNTKVAIAAMA